MERQIVCAIKFKINMPTCVDFMLMYAYQNFANEEARECCKEALPWIYFICGSYRRSRLQLPQTIAIAALCFVLQKMQQNEMVDALFD